MGTAKVHHAVFFRDSQGITHTSQSNKLYKSVKGRIPLRTAGQRTKEADKKKGIGEVYERKGFGSRYFRDKCI